MIACCIFGFVIYLACSQWCLDMLYKSKDGKGENA